ncbi:MAG: nucleotidyltransferase domain-containing protein [Anaerolineae bacterium]|nr:nucleotidyltransferase domain-containing protein [Anaerolineae bacterium]
MKGISEITQSLKDVLAKQPEVKLGYLFGSHARGRAHKLSDVDVAVLLAEGLSEREMGEIRIRLTAELMRALRSDAIDVVILNLASPLLRHRVLRDGKLLYSADEATHVRFVEDTYLLYLDHRHLYDILDETMFRRMREGRFGH